MSNVFGNTSNYEKSFHSISDEDKLKFILFPFQSELNMTSIRNNKQLQMDLLTKRIQVIHCLMNYVSATNRFTEEMHTEYFTF